MKLLATLLRPARLAFLSALPLALALPGCGGGSNNDLPDPVEPPVGVQQYPEGFWEGTVGTGVNEHPMVGFIDGGDDGKGGEFYLARSAAQNAGYDVLYGVLRTSGTVVSATGVTYFAQPDNHATTGMTLRANANADPVSGQTSTIIGSYSNPVVTGTTLPFKLNYSPINRYPTNELQAARTYSGEAGTFAEQWTFAVTPQGALTGRVNGCKVEGFMVPRPRSSALYTVAMNFSRAAAEPQEVGATCTSPGAQHRGVAVLRFDAYGVPSGIWVFMRSAAPTSPVLVLNGQASR